MRIIPWVLVGLLAAGVLFLLVGQSAPESWIGGAATPEQETAPKQAVEETTEPVCEQVTNVAVASTQPQCPPCKSREPAGEDGECQASLGAARAALARCLSGHSVDAPRPAADLEACLNLPALRDWLEPSEDSEDPHDPEDSELLDSEPLRMARYHTLRTLLEEDLELLPEEVEWLAEFACALRELRWATVTAMHDDAVQTAEVREMMLGERREVLTDLEAFLGPETYARFRQMGGIGLLNDSLDCHDELAR